jgi:beta-lactamase class A
VFRHKRITAIVVIVLLAGATYGVRQTFAHKTTPTPAPSTATKQSTSQTTPTVTTPPTDSSQLNQIITTWAAQQSFSSSVVVKQLTGGSQTASYKADTSMVPASTYKIYVAYAVLHGVEQGTYTLTQVLSDGHSVQTDLSNMILNSDNDAARALGFLVGWQNINTLLKSQGINSTNLYNYVPPSTQPVGDKHTTANDLATTLEKLYDGKLLNHTNTQLLLNLMKQQHYRERIPSGVPSGTVVADKPGWLSPADGVNEYVQNDAAIVYGAKSTYVLIIVTTGSSTQALANLSKLVYNQLEQ